MKHGVAGVLFILGLGLSWWFFYNTKDVENARWYRNYSDSVWHYGDDSKVEFTPGTYDVSSVDPNGKPTQEQVEVANLFRQDVLKNLKQKGLDQVQKARELGYKNGPPFDIIHFYNTKLAADGSILNSEKPEFLMYYPTAQDGFTLGGAMFLTKNLFDRGYQFGGQLTYWHFHVTEEFYCWENNIIIEYDEDGTCRGTISNRSPEMINVWVVDHPQGDFSTEMCLPSGSLNGWEGEDSWEAMSSDNYQEYSEQFRKKRYLVK